VVYFKKFSSITAILNFLLGVFSRYPNLPMEERALETVLFTLKAMANGGMHDHVSQVSEAIFS
jgi:uncharacterized protein YyaL (SSP411 family)